MEIIDLLWKIIKILFNPTSLTVSAAIFSISFVIVILVYVSQPFRRFFQGSDEEFLISKTTDLEEAMDLVDIRKLKPEERKKIAQCLKSIKKPLEEMLSEL